MSNMIDYEINKELGECYLLMGDFEKAQGYYKKAVATTDMFADPYLGLATIEVQFGNIESAHALYKKAVSIEATDKTLAGLGLAEMELGLHDSAFKHFTEALGMEPENMIALNGMLQCSYYLNRLEESIAYLESALSMQDADPVRFALAGCLTSLGREDEAKAHLEILLGRNPQYECAQELYASIAA